MRLSTALSALAGGLVLGWGALAAADPPPPAAAPPTVPIFYCPVPGAGAPAAATPASHTGAVHNGAGCPTGRTTATTTHHMVRHHQAVVRVAERRPTERWEERVDASGHLFMYRFNDAMDDMGPSCPHRGHPCPPEPHWGHMQGPDGAYADMTPPPAPPAMPHCHRGCPPENGVYAQALPAPAPPPIEPPCLRRHDCPQPPRFAAQVMPPLPPPAPHYDGHFAQMAPPPAPDVHCPRVHHDCPQGGYAAETPPPPPPRDGDGWWRSHHGMDDHYAQMAPRPAPVPVPAPPPVRVAQPPAHAFEQQGAAAGYAFERRETEHSSGWSYSEADGHGHYQHWDDRDGGHDGARPTPPRPPCPPRADHGCGGPAPYANGAGQWSDGSYGAVYEVTGRDAHGFLVWPGKNPDPN
jgi:hypothetical protein